MPRDWRAIFDRTCATARLIVSRVVSRFANSVIRPNGQRDHPRLIGGKRRGLEQVRFIGSQAQAAVPSALIAIVLEALHQFAGPRARTNAFHIRASCWGLGRSFRDAALDPATTGARVIIERPGRLLKRAKLLLTEATESGRSPAKTALAASSPAIPGLMLRDGSLILSHVRAEKADYAARGREADRPLDHARRLPAARRATSTTDAGGVRPAAAVRGQARLKPLVALAVVRVRWRGEAWRQTLS